MRSALSMRREHRGENLRAIAQRSDEVAIENRRAEQLAHRALELRIGDAVALRDAAFDLLFAADEVAGENGRRGSDNSRDPDGKKMESDDLHQGEDRSTKALRKSFLDGSYSHTSKVTRRADYSLNYEQRQNSRLKS